MTYTPEDFKKTKAKWIDLIVVDSDNLVIVDDTDGCIRFGISDDYKLEYANNLLIKGKKVAHSWSRYFVLSYIDLFEIYWPHSPLPPQVYTAY